MRLDHVSITFRITFRAARAMGLAIILLGQTPAVGASCYSLLGSSLDVILRDAQVFDGADDTFNAGDSYNSILADSHRFEFEINPDSGQANDLAAVVLSNDTFIVAYKEAVDSIGVLLVTDASLLSVAGTLDVNTTTLVSVVITEDSNGDVVLGLIIDGVGVACAASMDDILIAPEDDLFVGSLDGDELFFSGDIGPLTLLDR